MRRTIISDIMTTPQATPENSRYIPLTQQPACCVPTCLQMVMYKNNIPLIPAEEIGYHLGLVVHPDSSKYFYNARTSVDKPSAGYGTRIYLSEFEPNTAFKNLNIPLRLTVVPISKIDGVDELARTLQKIEADDGDALLCFNHGVSLDEIEKDWGHVVVFDRMVDGKVRIIDPSPEHPKWQLIELEKMFEAMVKHGDSNSGGIWLIYRK